jgi:hypothetical protein
VDGVVIYASTVQASRRHWGSDPLQAGVQVVERQELIQLPLNGGMRVEMSVPESNLTKLREGQFARIRVEAQPGREFVGRLSKIGMLPDGRNAWLNPDLKLYNCQVEIEAVEDLRAGMNRDPRAVRAARRRDGRGLPRQGRPDCQTADQGWARQQPHGACAGRSAAGRPGIA